MPTTAVVVVRKSTMKGRQSESLEWFGVVVVVAEVGAQAGLKVFYIRRLSNGGNNNWWHE